MLSDRYLRALNNCGKEIIEDLMVSDVLPDLRTDNRITKDDEEIIVDLVTSKQKAAKLLDILREKDDACFESFLEILGLTYEHLAEELQASIYNKRTRRMSESEFGNILIVGGVPDRIGDYVVRKTIEDRILTELKSESTKPILVHGEAGCGKSTLVSRVLHTDGLFPYRYSSVYWMPIGNIRETDVIIKLTTLSQRLDSSIPDPTNQIPELFREIITKKLRKNSALLVLDDIWSPAIMKYFTFSSRFIVTSRNSKLLSTDQSSIIMVPSKFSKLECSKFLSYNNDTTDEVLLEKVIAISLQNPYYLAMLKNVLKSNRDYISRIESKPVHSRILKELMQSNIDILDEKTRFGYKSLSILQEDETISVNCLSVYWNMSETETIDILNILIDNNLVSKKWMNDYNCNMYCIHDIQSKYLKVTYESETPTFHRQLIDRHVATYKEWLKFNYQDPFFFNHCASILISLKDLDTLKSLFTDFTFLASKIVVAGVLDLMFDYETYRPSEDYALWDEFNSFFLRHNHKFVQLPKSKSLNIKISKVFMTLIQLALMEKENSQVLKIAKRNMGSSLRKDFWVWENSEPSLKIWEANNSELIEYMDINQRGILITTDSGRLSLYEIKTGKCLFNYKISSERIIFSKFTKFNSLECLVINTKGTIMNFDIAKLLGAGYVSPEERDEDDDSDFVDHASDGNHTKVDLNNLRKNLLHMVSEDFTKKCAISTPKPLKTTRHYYAGFIGIGRLFVASIDENIKSASDWDNESQINCYKMDSLIEEDGFTIKYVFKKIFVNHSDELQIYLLHANGSSVILYDDSGHVKDSYHFGTNAIMDFIVSGNDIYFAIKNEIYKNKEPVPLFIIAKDAHIQKISICSDKTLMALCLTNQSVQIWSFIQQPKLLYSVKGFEFSEAQFECCNHLVAIEQSNISKWSMSHLSHGHDKSTLIRHINYRSEFHMYTRHPSSITWILQKYNGELEFRSFEDGHYKIDYQPAASKATCFSVEDNYAFIGFLSSHLQIYDLSNLSNHCIIETVDSVNHIMMLSVDEIHWTFIVHYENIKIKVFRLLKSDLSIVNESSLPDWPNLSKIKLFKIKPNNVMIGWCLNNDFKLYNVNAEFELTELLTKPFNKDFDILDFDVSDKGEFLCAASSSGELIVWDIQDSWERSDKNEEHKAIRICRFRPSIENENNWNVVAYVDDDGGVRLLYFNEGGYWVNIIIEDYPPYTFGLSPCMKWTYDGCHLLLGDNEIKKWKVALKHSQKEEVMPPLIRLNTHSGGIRCIHDCEGVISTVDRSGYFYILKKI